mgnify:CR=1 FL=1
MVGLAALVSVGTHAYAAEAEGSPKGSVDTMNAVAPEDDGDPSAVIPEEPQRPSAAEAATLHYNQGMDAYQAKHFYDAARAFDAAYAALPKPILLLNSGLAWEHAQDHLRALTRFKALRDDPEATPELSERAKNAYARIIKALSAQAEPTPEIDATFEALKPPVSEREGGIGWEWFGIRLFAGVYNLTDVDGGWFWPDDTQPLLNGEMVFFTMLWDWGYWDILRVGAGWPMVLTWGGSVGYRQRWGPHELRTGLHITNLIFPVPMSSGAEAIYLRRYESFNLEAGARINIFPTSLSAFVGLKF